MPVPKRRKPDDEPEIENVVPATHSRRLHPDYIHISPVPMAVSVQFFFYISFIAKALDITVIFDYFHFASNV